MAVEDRKLTQGTAITSLAAADKFYIVPAGGSPSWGYIAGTVLANYIAFGGTVYPISSIPDGSYLMRSGGTIVGDATPGTIIKSGVIGNPNSWYTSIRAQIPIFLTPAALTITRIVIKGADSTPTSELAGDLKFADDVFTGSFANATVIDVCDTTNGSFDVSSGFDDATVPAGKWIYFQMDSAPHADWKDMILQFEFTYD